MEASAATGPVLEATRPRLLGSDERLVAAVRAGSERAFEAIFDRYQRGLLGFCRHMLGSVEEAEDAVQHVFLAAYRDLTSSDRAIDLRPWLYTIARNRCLSALRTRRERPAELPVDAATEHLSAEVQRRQDVRDLLADVARLPEEQRAALVLAELATMPHAEIADVLGCPREKVKSLVFQARSSLVASRAGRETPCSDIQRQLATERGGALRRTVIRRHLRECAGCREFRAQLRRQRRLLGLVLPVGPSAALKAAVLGGETLGGGGASALVAKALTVAVVAGGGTAAVREVREHPRVAPPAPHVATKPAATPHAGKPVELGGVRVTLTTSTPRREAPARGGSPAQRGRGAGDRTPAAHGDATPPVAAIPPAGADRPAAPSTPAPAWPHATAETSPHGAAKTPPRGRDKALPQEAAKTSPHGAAKAPRRGGGKASPHGAAKTSPHGPAKTPRHGGDKASPHGAATTSPHGTAKASPRGTAKTAPDGTAKTAPHGTAKTAPHGTPTTSLRGAATTSPHGAAKDPASPSMPAGETRPPSPSNPVAPAAPSHSSPPAQDARAAPPSGARPDAGRVGDASGR